MNAHAHYDVAIVGAGPAGATAAHELALAGHTVVLIDGSTRVKPCGGAIPPRLIEDFAIPDHLLEARVRAARIVAPSSRAIDMPIDGGFVGMVDREVFDEWLRERAVSAGAERLRGQFTGFERDTNGNVLLHLESGEGTGLRRTVIRARAVIGADGASSQVARAALPDVPAPPMVHAYHEIVSAPPRADFDGTRCDVYYQGHLSPDFYGWVFPHGERVSIGVGTAHKGFSMRRATTALRDVAALGDCRTIRREGAPIPLRPRKRWDNRRDTVLAGDAAGVVAPASGEGIYYAMASGRYAARAVATFLATGNPRDLAAARRGFMREHGRVFWILGIMQRFWYSSDARRERFVAMCADPDVQRLTWEAYMHKRLVRAQPLAHVRIFFKDLAHLLGLTPAPARNERS